MVLACLLSLPFFVGLRNIINEFLKQGMTSEELRPVIQQILSRVFETLPWVLGMVICSVFSAFSIAIDKVKRTLESLLATPLSLRQIWLGKSLAVALPGVAVGLLISLLVLLAMNLMVVVPAVGSFVMPDVISLLTGLIIVPLMAFLVVSLVGFIQLIVTDPRIANFAFIVAFLAVYISTFTNLLPSGNLTIAYLIATVFLGVLILFLSRFLTVERVVLSSKG
jgi:ABC-2 type transport system permease protein